MNKPRPPAAAATLGCGLLLAFGAIGAACGPTSPSSEAAPPPSLRSIDIPPGFTFDASRAITVAAQVGFAASPTGGLLRVESLDGRLLYAGGLVPERTTALALVLPAAEPAVTLELRAQHRGWRVEVPVIAGRVEHIFTEVQ